MMTDFDQVVEQSSVLKQHHSRVCGFRHYTMSMATKVIDKPLGIALPMCK